MWTQKALVTGDVMSTCGVDGIVDRTNMERMTQCGASCYGVQHAQCCNADISIIPLGFGHSTMGTPTWYEP